MAFPLPGPLRCMSMDIYIRTMHYIQLPNSPLPSRLLQFLTPVLYSPATNHKQETDYTPYHVIHLQAQQTKHRQEECKEI